MPGTRGDDGQCRDVGYCDRSARKPLVTGSGGGRVVIKGKKIPQSPSMSGSKSYPREDSLTAATAPPRGVCGTFHRCNPCPARRAAISVGRTHTERCHRESAASSRSRTFGFFAPARQPLLSHNRRGIHPRCLPAKLSALARAEPRPHWSFGQRQCPDSTRRRWGPGKDIDDAHAPRLHFGTQALRKAKYVAAFGCRKTCHELGSWQARRRNRTFTKARRGSTG